MSYYCPFNDVYSTCWANGVVDRGLHQHLQQLRQENQLSDREKQLLDRMFHAVRRGWLQLV